MSNLNLNWKLPKLVQKTFNLSRWPAINVGYLRKYQHVAFVACHIIYIYINYRPWSGSAAAATASAPVDALPGQSQNLIDVDMECVDNKSGDGDVVPPSRMTTLSYSPTLEMLVGASYVDTVFQNQVHSLSRVWSHHMVCKPYSSKTLEQFFFEGFNILKRLFL